MSTCDTCRYSEIEGHPDGTVSFQCHRLPPHTIDNMHAWPTVNSDDWCGEWEQTK